MDGFKNQVWIVIGLNLNLPADGIIALPLLVGLLSYGLVILNRGLFLDGWFLEGWSKKETWHILKRFTGEVGMPFIYFLHKSISSVRVGKTAYNFINVISLIGSAYAVSYLCVQSGYLNLEESMLIAALMLAFPGQQIACEKSVTQYFLCTLLFYLGAVLNIQSELSIGTESVLLWIASLTLLFLSFNMNSLLVYYLGFLIYKIVFVAKGGDLDQSFLFLIKNSILVIMPPLFWILKGWMTPKSGYYLEYNSISFQPKRLFQGLVSLISEGTLGCYVEAVRWFLKNLIWVVLMILSIWAGKSFVSVTPSIDSTAVQVLIFSVFLILLAACPYILVGQPFGTFGWATKNNVLLALPCALFIYSGASIVFKPEVKGFFLMAVIFVGVIYLIHVYASWIALWAKNLSALKQTAEEKLFKNAAIVEVCDSYPTELCNRSRPEHWDISLTYMFTYQTQAVHHFGIVGNEQSNLASYSSEEIKNKIIQTTVPYV
ncbi:MAG: hypothetical protein HQ462_10535, partial [Deltaproteobacteria bacterium]|nr:hypothetical protein [Deltaproteobacteria bacterium]